MESNTCTDRLSRNKKVGTRNAIIGVPELVRLYTDASRRLTSSGTAARPTAARKSSRMASHCHVSGHGGHLLQDIAYRPAASEWLVRPGQGAYELAVLGDDADVGTGD